MLFENIGIIDENFEYQPNRWVGVLEDKIAYVGTSAPENAADYGEVYAGKNRLMIPAMYNAHSHVPMTLLRGYAEDATLQEWLNNLVWPFEAKMTEDDSYWATLLSCAEMARYGVAGYTDMYRHTEARAKATTEVGIKANLSEGIIAFEDKPFSEYYAYDAYKELVPKLHGSDDGRILMEYAIHAEYTTCDQVARDIVKLAKKNNMAIQMHISETKQEHAECKQRKDGMTPVQYFDSIGAFDTRVIAAHCVWAEPEDIDILAKRGVFVASCPASNMKLGSGFAPDPEMLAAGVNLCLGTDGMASNNNHDMLQDMYLLALTQKGGSGNPAVITPQEALRTTTRMGALAQGREDCGLIKEGFKADLAIYDTSDVSWCPMTDPLRNLLYAGQGNEVITTLCDGRVVYHDGEWPRVDIERIKEEVNARAARIIAELKADQTE